MDKNKLPIYIIIILSIIGGFFHLTRMIMNIPMIVGDMYISPQAGGITFAFSILLAAWGFYALASLKSKPPKQ